MATRDAIRHWAHGVGDRNPYWLRRGIAPPSILFAMDRIVSGYVGGLPGIHAMYSTDEETQAGLPCRRVIPRGRKPD